MLAALVFSVLMFHLPLFARAIIAWRLSHTYRTFTPDLPPWIADNAYWAVYQVFWASVQFILAVWIIVAFFVARVV